MGKLNSSGSRTGLLLLFFTLLSSKPAHADPSVEISGGAGFGGFVAGVTSGRFMVSPSGSVSVRGEYGFVVLRDTLSFLGITGGRFGVNNETTLGGGLFWEHVNLSAGLSLTAFWLPICGPRLCGQMRGIDPGASVRLDIFTPLLSDGLGVSADCAGTWITGGASSVWNGISVRCSLGPIVRFTSGR